MKLSVSRAVGIAAAMTTLLGAAVVTSEPAMAGTNGQQVMVCGDLPDGGSAAIQGINQNGVWTASHRFPLRASHERWHCKGLPNWWWKGQVNVDIYDLSGAYLSSRTCNVPEWDGSDWFQC